MTNKLEQAARQALEALEVSTDWDVGAKGKQLQSMKAITALREALASCRLTTTEQTEQEPVAWLYKTERKDFANNRGLMFTKNSALKGVDWIPLYSEPVKSVEQEPVAWRDDFERCRVQHVESFCHSHKVFQMMQKYAAPVRTKDLTDKQIEKVWNKNGGYMGMPIDFARAVIAKDREKNKCQ